jgi:hypothetical protein
MSISSKEQKKTLSVFLPIKFCGVKSTFLELISGVLYSVGHGTIIRKEDQALNWNWLFPLNLRSQGGKRSARATSLFSLRVFLLSVWALCLD